MSGTKFIHKNDLIGTFAQHKVAANLLMVLMILAGIWALSKLNTQFFPNFSLEFIRIQVVWQGSTSEDVESYITIPIEQRLRTLAGVRKMTSTSSDGIASITLEYEDNSDMGRALDQVKEEIALLRNLPEESEEPEITHVVRYEPVARLLISGGKDLQELRNLAYEMEDELLSRGIAKVFIQGLPEDEIAIQIPANTLDELGLTLEQVSNRVSGLSLDLPAGSIGKDDMARSLRSMEQRRDTASFAELPLIADDGRLVRLGDVATISRRGQEGEVHLFHNGRPAIELQLSRTDTTDSLKSAQILEQWLEDTRPTLSDGISLEVYDEPWRLLKGRIMLLVKNGAGGLLLVVAILFLFLNGRVAFWVAVGIPVSFMAMLAALYVAGGSINMISLFAMIMGLGIIVDDAIVVGEDALAHYQSGENSLQAAEGGARRMLAPVMSSSLTTIATFLPLMMIHGVIGKLLFAIPLVIICVIIASLIESFLVLPGHLRHSFHKMHHQEPAGYRLKLDQAFNHFRDNIFRPMVTWAVDQRYSTAALAVGMMMLTIGVLQAGYVNFTFFPQPEGTRVFANASFAAGTPPERVETFLEDVDKALKATEEKFGGNLVEVSLVKIGTATVNGGANAQRGDQFGSLVVELTEPDSREIRNKTFIRAWQEAVTLPPGIQSFTILEPQGGPPGQDIQIRFTGSSTNDLKAAALELTEALKSVNGVNAVEDDMPYGKEQLIYRLTPQAEALGLTVDSVGRQLRAFYDGRLAQIFQEGDDEIEVRVMLPDEDRNSLSSLDRVNLLLPDGSGIPLSSVIELRPQRGFEALRHADGSLAVEVSGSVDTTVNNAEKIIEQLEAAILPDLVQRYSVKYSLEGRAADSGETLTDMKRGLIFAVILVYLVLAWVFASYGWPFVVMLAIPFGLVGAFLGHLVMGIDLTILSLFGFFGLSGIVVNDSIILVTFFKQLREEGMAVREAIIEASCLRLRAVLLTSLTTIAGLTPLLFETSLQAQFLIPMATSIAFGLMFSTILVLLCIPAFLAIYESLYDWAYASVNNALRAPRANPK